ncbi:hypothetical protein BC939DRAFT_43182 [Gamsiella multidivaricata]|uniref:uncharacterized protein n=1 Tax=Gamsiella multidivaricata TaxID=101098 RepID=UPI00221F70CC|nr:uncharacterized protein BC939DRAFT_43182 [Gamsiella multidivaricata]KAI7816500.1 hypothetical protein BC939DRAFT_43182 [Gamsiella multidivaricata]
MFTRMMLSLSALSDAACFLRHTAVELSLLLLVRSRSRSHRNLFDRSTLGIVFLELLVIMIFQLRIAGTSAQ